MDRFDYSQGGQRIYVCHTYYHVYITFLKELSLPRSEQGRAELMQSTMSTDFEALQSRVESTGLNICMWVGSAE